MRKILIFLWLTAPLAWSGKETQKPPLSRNSSETTNIEVLGDYKKETNFGYRGFSRKEEREKKESAEEAWNRTRELTKEETRQVTKEEIRQEIMDELPDILDQRIEEKFRKIQEDTSSSTNPLKKEEENSGFFKRLTQKIWGKNQSIISDDAISASKGKIPEEEKEDTEEKKTGGRTPSGAKSLIKMVGHEVKIPLKKVILSAGLVALGFFANEFKNELFPKDTENEELDNLSNQMNNFTLNATTESEETSWFEQGLVAPLNHATTLFGDSWNTLWGRIEEAQKEISSNGNHLPETEKLAQKGLASKTETEL